MRPAKPAKSQGATPPTVRPSPKPGLLDLQLSVQFLDPQHRALLPRHHLRRWLLRALAHPTQPTIEQAQITLRFVGEAEGLTLNQQYRKQRHATNILTFAYQHQPLQADLVFCSPVVAQEAAQQGKRLADHYAHLLVHGALHALGWEHEKKLQAEQMEQLEIDILAGLGLPNPYAYLASIQPSQKS